MNYDKQIITLCKTTININMKMAVVVNGHKVEKVQHSCNVRHSVDETKEVQ